ncbi:Lrp/AsnC family transcriptional regulator [Halalkalicoccus jeotgali]|uniref:Putative AsnC family transcriptional regulator n=1 Tax=Halalkalicoccus jeotgali (strain DSM 18796 / CECT 7217 / JCM 14584 / KCTC 4019 / B3) TaxID=795797 RepID=D8J4T6_HALJB|nr:Lrp/AsnC family transcriptional regulator [Halalkalicoccus jeotgali]ADJ15553.1 putative transcriptional regulator, AsnC family protein [Halalkalicoccus jeotgali B3]ELY36038.1 putative AsnC family transcriptional regulator [Halalkalicoccus jeotgali B3]
MRTRLDDIDKRILYYLRVDARNTTAPMIAEEVDVSAATIRNRIGQLEERGVIQGYHADIDYETAEGKLMNIFLCNAPTSLDDVVARVLQVPGVVHVRSTMTGRENLHVQAIGDDTGELTRIKRELAELGLDIEDEGLVNGEYYRPYDQYGPAETHDRSPLTDVMSLSGGAEVIEIPVMEDAPLAERTVEEAVGEGILSEDVLVIAVEREDDVITPRGGTALRVGDVVTVLSREGVQDDLLEAFTGLSSTR